MNFGHQIINPVTLCIAMLVALNSTDPLQAQRGKSSQGRASQAKAIDMLVRQMDTNKNGYIDPAEMKGLAKKYAQRGGLDINRSHSISKVVQIVQSKGKTAKDKTKTTTEKKVPDFSVEAPDRLGIADFSPSGEERMTLDMMKRKFSASVMSQVEQTMKRNDKDKSGNLDVNEIARSRWSNPTWQESDTNNDQKLTRLELAYRYQGREEKAKQKTSSRASSKKSTSSTSSSLGRNSASNRNRSNYSSRSSRASSLRRTSSSSSSKSKTRRGFNSGNDAYKRYAEGLLKSYDDDKDGRLSKTELKDMKRPPKNADKNRDGYVDKSELVSSVQERSGTSADKDSASNSKATDKLRRSSKSKHNENDTIFGGKDTNGDRQLQMVEFSQEWDDEIVKEFEEKDLNGDGVITEAEWKA